LIGRLCHWSLSLAAVLDVNLVSAYVTNTSQVSRWVSRNADAAGPPARERVSKVETAQAKVDAMVGAANLQVTEAFGVVVH
jgi:hypothetical protein